jgi:hypothetical protein
MYSTYLEKKSKAHLDVEKGEELREIAVVLER